MKPLDSEQLAVRELARDCDPIDIAARLMVRGYRVTWPCPTCGGSGAIPCDQPDHGKSAHHVMCRERPCGDPRCGLARRLLLEASVEANRIREEER